MRKSHDPTHQRACRMIRKKKTKRVNKKGNLVRTEIHKSSSLKKGEGPSDEENDEKRKGTGRGAGGGLEEVRDYRGKRQTRWN